MLLIKQKQNQIFSISIVNINKALYIKEITNLYIKLPEYYYQYLDVFDQRVTD
jgi:hypothetical protein